MNKQRREKIAAILDELANLQAQLEEVLSEEQDYFDAMPEGLQSSEKGEKAEECISNLESAISDIESAIASTEEASA